MSDLHPPLKPGDLPRQLSVKERRRLAAEDADDYARHVRPNEPDGPSKVDRCLQSKYSEHRFLPSGKCDFCGRHWRDCQVTR